MFLIAISSLLVNLIFAPLGCFILWKRYVYFADSLAHASIIASVISCLINVPALYSLIIGSVIFTTIIFLMKNQYENNSAIGLTASAMIAVAVAISDFFPDKVKIKKLLIGDIVSVNFDDLVILFLLTFIVFTFLLHQYRNLIICIISPDIAHSKGINVKLLELLFLFMMSFAILFAIKMVGVLLIISIILIPPMTAQIVVNSPKKMIYYSVLFAVIMNIFGMVLYCYTPVSFTPSITLSGCIMFFTLKQYKLFKNLYKTRLIQ